MVEKALHQAHRIMESLITQVVYFGFFQSIFLLLIFLFSPKNRRNINGFIAYLVVILMIGLLGRVLFLSEIFGRNLRLISLSEMATLLFGPTVFLFTRSTLHGQQFETRALLHYLPAVVYNLAVLFVFVLPSDEELGRRIPTGELFRTISLFIGVAIAFNFVYWWRSYRLFLDFKKKLQEELSFTLKTQFFHNFLLAIGGCLIAWVTFYLLSFTGNDMIERSARQFIWLSLAFIILFIAYYGMTAPELYRFSPTISTPESLFPSPAKGTPKYAKSKLDAADLDALKDKLEGIMREKKPFLNRKLMKAELAAMLGVSNPEIARLLNERIGMNFFEYVNYYRIMEFVELAQKEEAKQLTFYGLAQEAGFNSKTTFNKSFKKLMGTTPKEYFLQQKGR